MVIGQTTFLNQAISKTGFLYYFCIEDPARDKTHHEKFTPHTYGINQEKSFVAGTSPTLYFYLLPINFYYFYTSEYRVARL